MKKYIGVKIVEAAPMMGFEASQRGIKRIWDEEDQEGYRVVYPDGHVSWCPKEQFEEANRECDCMTFGMAIEALKKGFRVARKGWNGKGMYLFLIGTNMSSGPGIGGWTYTNGVNDNLSLLPFIAMKTADDKIVPWLASQTDILAEDWQIIVE